MGVNHHAHVTEDLYSFHVGIRLQVFSTNPRPCHVGVLKTGASQSADHTCGGTSGDLVEGGEAVGAGTSTADVAVGRHDRDRSESWDGLRGEMATYCVTYCTTVEHTHVSIYFRTYTF